MAKRTGTKEQDNQTRREKHKPLRLATALQPPLHHIRQKERGKKEKISSSIYYSTQRMSNRTEPNHRGLNNRKDSPTSSSVAYPLRQRHWPYRCISQGWLLGVPWRSRSERVSTKARTVYSKQQFISSANCDMTVKDTTCPADIGGPGG
jgi:hypothetical protein